MFGECEYDSGEDIPKETMTKEQMKELTDRFLTDIFPETVSKLFLSSIIDFDVFFMLEYCQKDELFGLDLPNSGVTFNVYNNGMIMDVTKEEESFSVEYPKEVVPSEKAKQRYLSGINAGKLILQYDEELFVNGDGKFRLVYDFNSVAIDVKMDGLITNTGDLDIEPQYHKDIPSFFAKAVSSLVLAGVEGMKKIAEVETEAGFVEVWSHFSLEKFREDYDMEDLIDLDFGMDDIVKFIIDPSNGKLKRLVKGGEQLLDRMYTAEEAYLFALKILSSQFKDAHQMFKLHILDPEIVDYNDEGEELPPYAYCFTFDRFENGVRIENAYIAITVNASTGELQDINTSDHTYIDFTGLTDVIPDNFALAKNLYEQSFTMKLQWVKEVDENGKSRYDLVYMPTFKGAGGHILYYDVYTLEPWTIDVTGLEEY
ncbi:hypothetical protein [Lederbergia lenta]|uniref:YcdC n=1 Tax=Lederbergia lenta TaxID=1467 RepID=A0A2X4WQP5_LEDLE|nr:hypothetical protein [Lederbergia lenta]MEC2323943.1 hypothetical protein [Lederbergia lenta]SQI60982.1 YcdC [Lederbergia lenta]